MANNFFKLTLDTLAPSGSISAERYYNANGEFTIVKGDAERMAVWFDKKEEGVREDAPAFVPAADTFATAFAEDGNYYGHLVLVDDVGNESAVYNTGLITFDATKPVVGSVSINEGASFTTKQDVSVVVEFSDALAGAVSIKLYGDLETEITRALTAEEIAAGKATISTKLTALTVEEGEEGAIRTVRAIVTDAAGNVADEKVDTIELDTVAPSGALYLKTADGSANLPAYVNDTAFAVEIDVDVAHTDVIRYTLTGDFVGTPKSGEISGNKILVEGLALTEGDGVKTIAGTIVDEAGNVYQLAPKTVNLAQNVGTASIITNKNYISKIEGYTTATITTTVKQGSAEFASWELKSGETVVKSGAGAPPATIEVSSADAPLTAEGAHGLKLYVTDIATNVIESNEIIVNSDFTGPVASEITVNAWYKAQAGFVASANDGGAGMATMQAWISESAQDEAAKGTEMQYAQTGAGDTAKFDWSGANQSDSNFVHIKYVDAVGNVTYAHSAAFGYDTVAPGAGSISIPAYTNTPSINATIGYNDATSGVEMMKVWGNIEAAATENDAEWVPVATSYAVTLTAGDGNKTVYVKFKDVAGNESAEPYASATGELDQTVPSATLALTKADGVTTKPAHSVLAAFGAHIGGGDDALVGTAVEYLLYGDFTYGSQGAQGVTEAAATWTKLELDAGKAYMTITDMYATSGDGTKNIYLKVKDNAGNVSTAAVQSFVYDTTAPTVEVSGVDYNRISKMHTARTDNSAKFNDETNFVFTPDSVIQAYKVVAYADEAAANAGSSADAAIGIANGSVNMSATGLNSNSEVAAMIRGADLEAASMGDGIKIVVVYVQDLAGTWSVAAKFAI